MGVKDLWKLLEPTGRPVSLESLQGLILAVDVSVWLHQAVHGARDREGHPLQSAHLSLLFSRICKLLHYQIKPVFVFDGGTPTLKHQTLAQRSQRRRSASRKGQRAEEKQRLKYMQAKILEQLTGQKSSTAAPQASSQRDIFDLPPLDEEVFTKERSPVMMSGVSPGLHDVGSVDISSSIFASLPPEVQHEILQEKQEMERYSHTDPSSLPMAANDFSTYQLSKLMTRSKLNQRLEDVRKVLKSSETVTIGLEGQPPSCEVEASRIMSSDSAHYILVKGMEMEGVDREDLEPGPELDVESGLGGSVRPSDLKDGDVIIDRDDVITKSSTETLKSERGIGLEQLGPESSHPAQQAPTVEDGSQVTDGEVEQLPLVQEVSESQTAPGPLTQDIPHSQVGPGPQVEEVSHSQAGHVPLVQEVSQSQTGHVPLVEEVSHSQAGPLVQGVSHSQVGPSSGVLHEAHTEDTLASDTSMGTEKCILPATDPQQLMPEQQSMTSELTDTAVPPAHHGERIDMSPLATPSANDDSGTTEPLVDTRGPVSSESDSAGYVSQSSREDSPRPIGPEPSWRGKEEEEGVGWEEDLLQLSPEAAQLRLREEGSELDQQRERQIRAAASISSHVYREAQELMSIFGMPYIVSPMEAEAQCAYLDHTHQTHGTITDDSDVFLFGGQKVYRHFFHHEREAVFYNSEDITSLLGLKQSHLVCLAYLLGSDYTAGLEGVGVVNAVEVIGRFRGDGMEPLRKLKEWHSQVNSAPGLSLKSSLEKKLRGLVLPDDFPSAAVWQAYMSPEVDNSREHLQWGTPDLDLIRKFMANHVGWNQDKVDSQLLPILKRVNRRESQRSIRSYMITSPSRPQPPVAIKSNRLRNAVARITNTGASPDDEAAVPPKPKKVKGDESESSSDDSFEERVTRGRRGRGRGKGRGRGRGRGKKTTTDEVVGISAQSRRETGKGSTVFCTRDITGASNLSASSSSSEPDEFDTVVRGLNDP